MTDLRHELFQRLLDPRDFDAQVVYCDASDIGDFPVTEAFQEQ